jgi:hypothetical protein
LSIARTILLAALAMSARGQEPFANLQFSGFGTLGLAGTGTHAVGYRRDNSQPAIAAAIDKPTGELDSRIGLQLSSRIGGNLLATLQVISKLRYDNTFTPTLSLATVAWTPVSNLQLRAGLMNFEILPSGDYSNIGYGYLWVRPPVEALAQSGAGRAWGAELSHIFSLAPGTSLQLGAFAGVVEDKVPATGQGVWDLSGGRLWGSNARLQIGNLKLRAAYSDIQVARNLPGDYELFREGFRQFAAILQNPQLNQLADQLDLTGTHVRGLQLGAAWECGPYQVQGICAQRRTTNPMLFPTLNSGFVSFGYRLGPVVPYVVYARAVSGRPARPDLGNLGSLPSTYGPLAVAGRYEVMGLDAMLNANGFDQYTWSAGLRWDVRDGVDLKFQADRVRAHDATSGVVNLHPMAPTQWDGRMTVLSVALDFIFGGGR